MRRTRSDTEYLFKVRLKAARRIWRTIALRGDQTLDDLHEAVFDAFDRDNLHLYSFYFPKAPGRRRGFAPRAKEYTASQMFDEPDLFGEEDRFNAAETRLDDLQLRSGQQFEYLFDFGDSWWHEIAVEAVGPVKPRVRYPQVVERKGTSPQQYEDVDE